MRVDGHFETTSYLSKPTFSVVIPVYNKGPYVRRAVSSVLSQTFQEFELLLVEDASTDNSRDEIEKFNDPRIRIFHRAAPGAGGYAARNMGIKKATGDWIAFLDADDEWFPEHLDRMHELAIMFPDCQFLSCQWQNVYPDGLIDPDRYSQYNEIDDAHSISFLDYLTLCVNNKRPTHTCVACIRNNDVAVDLFPDGRTSRGGDQHAWRLHLAQTKKMAYSPHLGANYHRISDNCVTASALSSTNLANGLVQDFEPIVTPLEMRMLKKYSNRNLFEEWLRHRMLNEMPYNLPSNLYWYGDTVYCLSRLALSFLPGSMLRLLVKSKGAARQMLLAFRNLTEL